MFKKIIAFLLLFSLFQTNRCMQPGSSSSSSTAEGSFEKSALFTFAKQMFMRSFTPPLSDPHPLIKQEAEKALRICKISDPVVILQNDHSIDKGSAAVRFGDQKVILLFVSLFGGWENFPMPLIKFCIYHECGHISAGDLDNTEVADEVALNRERRANQFAIDQLIRQHDVLPLIMRFLEVANYFFCGNTTYKSSNHPSWQEEGFSILQNLKKAGVNLKDLPITEKELQTTPLPEYARTKKSLQSLFDVSVATFLLMTSHK